DIVWNETLVVDTGLGEFELLSTDSTPPPVAIKRLDPIDVTDFASFFDGEGRLVLPEQELRERVFRGGCDRMVRKPIFKYLMGLYPWSSTKEQRLEHDQQRRQLYTKFKNQWYYQMVKNAPEKPNLEATLFAIEKDVVRTDQHLDFFKVSDPSVNISKAIESNRNLLQLRSLLMTWTSSSPFGKHLGFVQGMADLASPLLYLMEDESDAFWCFTHMMERFKHNFSIDGTGMKQQLGLIKKMIAVLDPILYAHLDHINALDLFCCFRWVLVLFKREFQFKDILPLWEFIFSDALTLDMHLFIAVQLMLDKRTLLLEMQDPEQVLKECLGHEHNLEKTLFDSEALLKRFRDVMHARG
ncbi:rab-GTPase-TBC domain-containing protein, partial [Gorgonomyces haynaldii]